MHMFGGLLTAGWGNLVMDTGRTAPLTPTQIVNL